MGEGMNTNRPNILFDVCKQPGNEHCYLKEKINDQLFGKISTETKELIYYGINDAIYFRIRNLIAQRLSDQLYREFLV